MPKAQMLLILAAATSAMPLLARDAPTTGQIYSHGVIRHSGRIPEAVVEVPAELAPHIHEGQLVSLDVRQGELRGIVKGLRSPVEVTIAIDARRSKVQLMRLQPGQAVFAVIQLEPDCDCLSPK